MDWNAVLKRGLAGLAVVAGVITAAGQAGQLPPEFAFLGPWAALIGGLLTAAGITSTGVKKPVEPPAPASPEQLP